MVRIGGEEGKGRDGLDYIGGWGRWDRENTGE